jgi:glycosyltransferase involved in cell wall biosynthesis
MQNVFFVTPSLDYRGSARQLCLIAARLPRDRFRLRVCVLGGASPWAESLRMAGVTVDVLGWGRPFDVSPFLALRRSIREFRPDVVHAWGPTALRAVCLLGGRGWDKIVASAALPVAKAPGWADRWLLHQATHVIAFTKAETNCYRRLGIEERRLTCLQLGAAVECGSEADDLSALPEVPAGARTILGVGPLERHKGFHDAIWALDILHYLYEDLHLVLVGVGPDRERLERFVRATGSIRYVHFTGAVPNLSPLWNLADVVWVPSLRPSGFNAALEAMQAGRPVVATRVAGMDEIVVDGETGYLIEPGDKAALARQTRLLLDNPELRAAFGAAGRRRVEKAFSASALAERVANLYESRAAVKKVHFAP